MDPDHGYDIIDAHHHYGNVLDSFGGFGDDLAAMTPEEFDRFELETRLRILESQGVRQAVIIGGHSYLRPDGLADTRRINDGVAAYRDRRPDRFPAAVGIVEPLYGPAGLPEIERVRDELGMVGISFHVRFQGVSLDSHWVRAYTGRMAELGLVPYVHAIADSPENSLWKVEALAHEFPDTTMVVLDAFSNFEQSREIAHVADRCPNLVFDTSLSYNADLIVQTIRRFGPERVVFGTDVYSWPLVTKGGHILGQLIDSGLDRPVLEAVLGGTLRGILGLSTGPAD